VFSAKDNFNAARMIARTACPTSAFAAAAFAIAAGLAIVAVLKGTEPKDWQEIPASAGLPKLSEFMIYLYITDGPESLLAHHLASIVRDAFLH
jgi:hypothetical protein